MNEGSKKQEEPGKNGDSAQQEGLVMGTDLSTKEAFDIYENGKLRRYNLLFSVNGGTFAIAKLLTGEPGKAPIVLGHLTLTALAVGMMLFTAVMVVDIYLFGYKMSKVGGKVSKDFQIEVFGPPGQAVLILLGLLVCAGWLLAAFPLL